MSERLAIIGADGALRLVSEDITGEDTAGCTVRDDVPEGYPATWMWDAEAGDWAVVPPPPVPPVPPFEKLLTVLVAEAVITQAQADEINTEGE